MREESALNMFRQMDLKGKSKDDTQLKTVHQNTIATIRTYDEAGGNVKKFSCEYPMVVEVRKNAQMLIVRSQRC